MRNHVAAAVLFALSTPVSLATRLQAAPVDNTQQTTTVRISIADLNLETAAGVAVAYRRIAAAAESVCGPRIRTGSRLQSGIWERCIAETVGRTVDRLDRVHLTAYHRQHSRGIPAG